MTLRQLTESEYFELQAQYDRTPAPEDSFGASGEHFIMFMMLSNMGFSVAGNRVDIIEMADKLLSMGYVRDES